MCRFTNAAVLLCLLTKATHRDVAQADATKAPGSTLTDTAVAARKRVGEMQKRIADTVSHLRFEGLRLWGPGRGGNKKGVAEGTKKGVAEGETGVGGSREASVSSSPASGGAMAATTATAAAADSPVDQHVVDSDVIDDDMVHVERPDATDDDDISSGMQEAPATANSATAATASGMGCSRASADVDGFMQALDVIIQRAFVVLRDQLKRRVAPLLANCLMGPTAVAAEVQAVAADMQAVASGDEITEAADTGGPATGACVCMSCHMLHYVIAVQAVVHDTWCAFDVL